MDRIIALGCFDGLHIAHMEVLRPSDNGLSTPFNVTHCLLFDVHPQAFLGRGTPLKLLDDRRRNRILLNMGIEPVILPFEDIHLLSPKEFADKILAERLLATGVTCGYNYHFGANAQGNAALLAELCEAKGIRCKIVPQVLCNDIPVSATRIREALLKGDTENATRMLGRSFGYDFKVLHGEARGRLLGYPTANQAFPPDFLVPRRGVYASRVILHGRLYSAMTNIGLRPTFDGEGILSETHIFNFDGELYGQRLPVELLSFIRDERTFNSAEELVAQLKIDAARAHS